MLKLHCSAIHCAFICSRCIITKWLMFLRMWLFSSISICLYRTRKLYYNYKSSRKDLKNHPCPSSQQWADGTDEIFDRWPFTLLKLRRHHASHNPSAADVLWTVLLGNIWLAHFYDVANGLALIFFTPTVIRTVMSIHSTLFRMITRMLFRGLLQHVLLYVLTAESFVF